MKNHYELLKQHFFNSLDHYLSINDIIEDPSRRETYITTAGADHGFTEELTPRFNKQPGSLACLALVLALCSTQNGRFNYLS